MSLKYPHLFEPIQLAGTFFKNRLFASPTGFQDLDGQGVLSEAAAAYYERKAMGGAASVASRGQIGGAASRPTGLQEAQGIRTRTRHGPGRPPWRPRDG